MSGIIIGYINSNVDKLTVCEYLWAHFFQLLYIY